MNTTQESPAKLLIYKGIVQYLLDTTSYSHKNIARLSNSSVKKIKAIHAGDECPDNTTAEIYLVKLFEFILELKHQDSFYLKFLTGEGQDENA